MKFAKGLKAPILNRIYEPLLLYHHAILFTMHEKDAANEAYLEPSETYMIDFFVKTVNGF